MSINDYIFNLESLINSSAIVSSFNLNIDIKTTDIAFISGRIEFRNSSILDFKEFIESVKTGIEKYKYAYNFRKGSVNIFRYDNAPDPNAKRVRTFPYHKHLQGGKIVESRQMELKDILEEIEKIYIAETDL